MTVMKSYDEYAKTAKDGRAFSNGTEWEIWSYNVCMGGGNDARRCINDDAIDEDGGCPLILLSLDEKTPAEWTGQHGRYRCTEKTTAADARKQEKDQQRVELADMHYDLFGDAS